MLDFPWPLDAKIMTYVDSSTEVSFCKLSVNSPFFHSFSSSSDISSIVSNISSISSSLKDSVDLELSSQSSSPVSQSENYASVFSP